MHRPRRLLRPVTVPGCRSYSRVGAGWCRPPLLCRLCVFAGVPPFRDTPGRGVPRRVPFPWLSRHPALHQGHPRGWSGGPGGGVTGAGPAPARPDVRRACFAPALRSHVRCVRAARLSGRARRVPTPLRAPQSHGARPRDTGATARCAPAFARLRCCVREPSPPGRPCRPASICGPRRGPGQRLDWRLKGPARMTSEKAP
jgi:hypothetical protein